MKRLWLYFLFCLAISTCLAETLLKLPPMPRPPVIDGRIGEEEWLGSSMQFGAISRNSNILARRVVYFFFGYDEHNLYFAHRSELPPAPMKVSEKEECFLTVQPPGADQPFVFRMRERKAPESQVPGHWESEIAIPLKELNLGTIEYGKPWKLQMSRQWCDPDEIADWTGKEAATFIPQKDIPATGFMGFWIYGTKPYRGQSCNFRWQAALTEQELDCLAEVSSLEVPRQFSSKMAVQANQATISDWRQLLAGSVDYSLKYDITLRSNGETIQSRVIPWNSAKGLMWIDPDPPIKLEVGIYPSFGKAKARLNCSSKEKLGRQKEVCFAIVDESGKSLWNGTPETPATPLLFQLPKLPEGGYYLTADYIGTDGKLEQQKEYFAIRTFPWQGLNLGNERLVIPPFKPLVVKNGCEVQALQTSFRLGEGGIAAVTALGQELLTSPVLLRIDGEPLRFSAPVSKEESPDRVIMEASATGKNLSVTALYEFDYDGMVKITWTFVPQGSVLLKNMTFDIPLRKEHGKYLHVVGDGMRRNIHKTLPDTEGLLWDSRKTGRPNLFPGGFHPYIWLGDTLRGLAWFAETSHNWENNEHYPAQEIIRSGDSVILRINLAGAEGLRRDAAFTIVTGMQPSPVKPMPPEGRRHSAESWEGWTPDNSVPFWIPGNNNNAIRWEYHPLTPTNGDFSHLHYLFKRAWKSQAESDAEIDDYMKRNNIPPRWSSEIFRYPDDLKTRMQQGVIRAGNAKYIVLYSNPRALVATWPEYDMYADEWSRLEWRSGRPSTLYGAEPDENYMDFILYYWLRVFKEGVSDGIYFDNIYDATMLDPVITRERLQADISTTTAYYPIFKLRELNRRAAVLLTQQGKLLYGRPLLLLHITDVNMLPVNSFAAGSIEWEMNFGSWPYPQRFSDAYLITNSTGVQEGLIPQLITQVAQGLDEKQREAINNSLLAVAFGYGLMSHRYGGRPGDHYKSIQNLVRNFGYGDTTRTEVYPGWHPENPVKCNLATVKVTAVKRNDGHWLLMIGNLASKETEAALSLPGRFTFADAESGEKLGNGDRIIVPIGGFNYRLIELQTQM